MPTSRPATIDKRGPMAREYQYEQPRAAVQTPLLRCPPMANVAERIRSRVLPALLTALGVAFLAGGVLSITAPVAADPLGTSPGAAASGGASVDSASASPSPSASALITF